MTPRHGDRLWGRQPASMPPCIESRKRRRQCHAVPSRLIFRSQLTTCISMKMCWRWTAGTVTATSCSIPMPWRLTITFTITWCVWHTYFTEGDRISTHDDFTSVNRNITNCHKHEEKTCWYQIDLCFLRWYMVETAHRSNSISIAIASKNNPRQSLWFSIPSDT